MRPAGDPRQALLKAAADLNTATKSATMRELITRSCVGREAAMHTVRNMKRAGLLVIVRTRRVDYRNRPVAEYAPKEGVHIPESTVAEWNAVFASWTGAPPECP